MQTERINIQLGRASLAVKVNGEVFDVDVKRGELVPRNSGRAPISFMQIPADQWSSVYEVMYPENVLAPGLARV